MRRAFAILGTVALAAGCSASSAKATPAVGLPDVQDLTCPAGGAPIVAPPSLPGLTKLARVEHEPVRGRIVHGGHGRAGTEPPIALPRAETAQLAGEIRAAADIACRLHTEADAQRAGYVLSSAYNQGVGTHWTNWNLVDQPFDVTRPSMLLFAPHLGKVQLVAFSYWVRAPGVDPPNGFTGGADHWHRHFGLCFDTHGIVEREDVTQPSACAGPWLNGGDIWMLHAWIVPGAANGWGLFAPLNPSLCSRTAPDIERCPQESVP